LSKARIILMDEATSSVDPESDAAIQDCISRDLAGSTMLIVAHRVNTVMHCNRVIVLE
jgi:ABC-type multidrug transport system fused ATPase/permease subunit